MSEPAAPGPPPPPTTADLLAKALATSTVLWVETAPDRAWALWFATDPRGRVLLASGGTEQTLPDLTSPVVLALRSKDTGARLLRVGASVTRLAPTDPGWSDAVALLAPRRLNAPPGDLAAAWAAAGTLIHVLEPDSPALEGPGGYDSSSGAHPPVDSAATTAGWKPWHVRGRPPVRRRRRAR